jgi:predicted amidohydrolase
MPETLIGQISMSSLKLAAIQMNCVPGNVTANLTHSLERIDRAAEAKPDLICFPESVLDGYSCRDPELPSLARSVPGPETERIAEAARRHGVWICWSLAESLGDGGVANTALLFDRNGDIQLHYQKTHLCQEVGETDAYRFGESLDVTSVDGIKVGVMICFDRHYPEAARELALKGAQLILHPTATVWFTPNPRTINTAMMRTRAYENRCYILSVNQVNYNGGSALFGPWGDVITVADIGEEILECEIDTDELRRIPNKHFALMEARRPHLYTSKSTSPA